MTKPHPAPAAIDPDNADRSSLNDAAGIEISQVVPGREDIARRAYEYWQARGCPEGVS